MPKNYFEAIQDSVKGRPVLDKDGNVIGRIGETEEKIPELTPEQKIEQGLIAQRIEREKGVEEAMNSLADYVSRLKKVQETINWKSFSSRVKAEEKIASLLDAIALHRKIISDEIQTHLGVSESTRFREMVAAHMRSFDEVLGTTYAPRAISPVDRIEQGLGGSAAIGTSSREIESTLKAAEAASGGPGSKGQ
jgi:hypothetical protein